MSKTEAKAQLKQNDKTAKMWLQTLVMQMGQFIDHDITHTPNHAEECCNKDGTFPDSFSTDKCYPIRVDESDPFWGSKGKTCMSLARSLKAPDLNCSLQFRQQVRDLSLMAKNAQHASGQNGY